jgi:hypothetical protein
MTLTISNKCFASKSLTSEQRHGTVTTLRATRSNIEQFCTFLQCVAYLGLRVLHFSHNKHRLLPQTELTTWRFVIGRQYVLYTVGSGTLYSTYMKFGIKSGQFFLPVLRFAFVSITLPMLHTRLHPNNNFYKKDKRAKSANFQTKQCCC